jgi:gamma-glutamyltranspeptidase/glutathione hydrolase
MELLKTKAGIAPVHVPYPGNPQIITAMLGGQVQLALLPPAMAAAQVRGGKLRAIGASSTARSSESSVPGASWPMLKPTSATPWPVAFSRPAEPPNSTGFVMLEILKIAERFDLAKLSDAERIHVLVEAKKRAFADRERYGADPRFEAVPLERILSDAHADAQAATISLAKASTVDLNVPMAAGGDTTYFCVVDGEGNCVSGIQSLNSGYGSGVTAGDTGILLNNRMAYWHLAPTHANRLVPGKRVRHTMNAAMVFKDGKLWAALGTPGADNQVQVNSQVLTAMIDMGADPQTALESPRWTSSQAGQGAIWPHEGDGALTIEEDFGAEILADLASRGHVVKKVPHLGGPCAVQAIRVLENGVRQAGSDPRRDGWAGAF